MNKCIYEISKSKHTWFQRYERSQKRDVRTNGRTDGQAQSNIPSKLLRSCKHNNVSCETSLKISCWRQFFNKELPNFWWTGVSITNKLIHGSNLPSEYQPDITTSLLTPLFLKALANNFTESMYIVTSWLSKRLPGAPTQDTRPSFPRSSSASTSSSKMSISFTCRNEHVFWLVWPTVFTFDTFGSFPSYFTREKTFVTSCLLSYTTSPFWKGVYSKREEFAPTSRPLFRRKAKHMSQLPPFKVYSFLLK